MKGHNICFHREIRKLSLNYPKYTLLSGALISSVTGLLHNRIMTPNIQEYLSLIIIFDFSSQNSPPLNFLIL